MKSKIISLFLALMVIVTVFSACGKEKAPDTSDPAANSTTTATGNTEKENTPTEENASSDGQTAPTVESGEKNDSAFFDAFESETIDGKKVTDDIFKGNKLTMINVWGTFCSPCINEMPDLQKLSEDYKDKGVKVIGIVLDVYDYTEQKNSPQKITDAKNILKQTGVKYQNILPSASLNKAKLDAIFSVPTTYFLNEKGEIIGSEYVGSRSYDEWSRIINNILDRA